MTRMTFAGVLLALALTGCGSQGSTEDAAPTTTSATPTSSVATAVEPPASASAPPLVQSEAAETPAGAEPEVADPVPPADLVPPVGTGGASDMPHGEQLYSETCQNFITAIDALAAAGASTREQSANGISARLQSNPSWSTLAAEDQQEILRGLDAAGKGSC